MLSQKCLAICNAQRLHLLASETQATRCVFPTDMPHDITKTSQYPVTDNINPGSLLPSVNEGATAQTLLPLNLLQYSWCNIASPLPLTQSCDMVLQRKS